MSKISFIPFLDPCFELLNKIFLAIFSSSTHQNPANFHNLLIFESKFDERGEDDILMVFVELIDEFGDGADVDRIVSMVGDDEGD
jgi:hypothetical protein